MKIKHLFFKGGFPDEQQNVRGKGSRPRKDLIRLQPNVNVVQFLSEDGDSEEMWLGGTSSEALMQAHYAVVQTQAASGSESIPRVEAYSAVAQTAGEIEED